MDKTNNITGDEDYKLWKFFKDEHDLILLDGQITDIVIEVEKYQKIKNLSSLLVDKATRRGHPEWYYVCPHCKEDDTLKYFDNYCCECGGKIHWHK